MLIPPGRIEFISAYENSVQPPVTGTINESSYFTRDDKGMTFRRLTALKSNWNYNRNVNKRFYPRMSFRYCSGPYKGKNEKVKESIGRGPPPSGPCSTSMPFVVGDLTNILSEPHIQQIVEMAVRSGTEMALTSIDRPLTFENMVWTPPPSAEQLKQEDREAMEARQQAKDGLNERPGIC